MRTCQLALQRSTGTCFFFIYFLALSVCVVKSASSASNNGIDANTPKALEKRIIEAYNSGSKKVVVPAGTYRMSDASEGAYLTFNNLEDFEIDATGVSLLRTDPLRVGIQFKDCRNVTLRGMKILNETPPFTQGVIEGIDPDGNWYDVLIDKGYPADFDSPGTAYTQPRATVIVPGTRQYKKGTKDCFFSRAERLGQNKFRFYFREESKTDPKTHPVNIGDWINFRGKVIRDIIVNGCEGMIIKDVTFESAGGFCILEEGGEGGNRYSYKVTYGSAPSGAEKEPLMASNADAFHSRNVRKGPILENCYFEGMHDDGVPIHGTFAFVAEASDNKVVIGGGSFMREGDPLRFYDTNGSFVGEAKIKSISALTGYKFKSEVSNIRLARVRQFWEVELDKKVKLDFEYRVSDPMANGAGYVIRNCTIRNHRARGLLLKSDNGLVEGNVIEGSTIAGIVVAPEIWWNEAGYSRKVIIRNNIIRQTGYSTVESSDHQSGAITICGAAGEPDQVIPVYQDPKIQGVKPGHRNILIENNTIEACDGINILLGMAEGVVVKGNRFIRPQQQLSNRGKLSGAEPESLIWIYNCKQVRFEDNTVEGRGSFGKNLITQNNNSRRIAGTEKGINLLGQN